MAARDWTTYDYTQGDLDCDEAIDRAYLHDTSPRRTGEHCAECGTALMEREVRYCGPFCEQVARDAGRLHSVSHWPEDVS